MTNKFMRIASPWRFIAGVSLLLATILTGCVTPTPPPPAAPVVNPIGSVSVEAGKQLLVNAQASGAASYKWTLQGNGSIPENITAGSILYTAPEQGDVQAILSVVASNASGSSPVTSLTIDILPGPTPTPTDTPIPTDTPTPIGTPTSAPTSWACTSYRDKVQKGDISGDVKIDTPQQGTTGFPAGQNVKVAGTYTGIPAGKYLWVFIYSPDAGLHGRYYPQTKDAVKGYQPNPTTGQDGQWALNINFGARSLCYEVVVVVGDAAASQSIADQLQKWAVIRNYTGYELNGPLSASPPNGPGLPDGLVEKASIEVQTK